MYLIFNNKKLVFALNISLNLLFGSSHKWHLMRTVLGSEHEAQCCKGCAQFCTTVTANGETVSLL